MLFFVLCAFVGSFRRVNRVFSQFFINFAAKLISKNN